MNFIDELEWRGMIQDVTPEFKEELAKGPVTGYVGFDPTAESLTVGNLVPIMMLVHFQRCGNKPIALVGGATGMIGDPSGKSAERNLLSIEKLRHNEEMCRRQLSHFLNFETGDNKAELLNNYDWFKDFGYLEFLRDVGKHISVNYMMAKDSVKSRLDSGISFTEFSYQLLQGYDFYHLNKNFNCKAQMGGSDQWGNITTGTELIRRMGGGDAFAVTCPLITKADGSKFGKSESGNVWLDSKLTSPYRFYQFWLGGSDEDAEKYIKIFTEKPKEEIEAMIVEHQANPGARIVQNALAEDITARVHGQDALEKAISATGILFGKSAKEDLVKLSTTEFQEIFEGVPSGEVAKTQVEAGMNILDLVVESGAFSSKGDAKRMIKDGGLRINKELCKAMDQNVTPEDLLNGEYILVQKGKKKYHIVYTR